MSKLYVTATISTKNKKIVINAESIKEALAVERELYTQKTLDIKNVRLSKSRPKMLKSNKEIITSIEELEKLT